MKHKQSILIFSQIVPYPLHDGGRFDVYYRLLALKELGIKTTLITFYNPKRPLPELEALEEICDAIYPIPYLRRKLSSLCHFKPYAVRCRNPKSALHAILKTLQTNHTPFDAILAESHHVLELGWWFKKALKIPTLYLRVHNDEPRFMMSVAKSSPKFSIQQLFFLLEALKYRIYEPILMKRFKKEDAILHISHDEWAHTTKKYPHIAQHFLPAAIDLQRGSPWQSPHNHHVLFVGALFAPNNLQGLRWYLNHVHPTLKQKFRDYRLIVAGNTKGADRSILDRLINRDLSIVLHDTPADLEPIYKEAAVFINPMRLGAGVKLKTIDAALRGLPIVTTTIGNEGTGLIDQTHVLVRDKGDDFATAVETLLTNPTKREALSSASKEYIQTYYDQKLALSKIFKASSLAKP